MKMMNLLLSTEMFSSSEQQLEEKEGDKHDAADEEKRNDQVEGIMVKMMEIINQMVITIKLP